MIITRVIILLRRSECCRIIIRQLFIYSPNRRMIVKCTCCNVTSVAVKRELSVIQRFSTVCSRKMNAMLKNPHILKYTKKQRLLLKKVLICANKTISELPLLPVPSKRVQTCSVIQRISVPVTNACNPLMLVFGVHRGTPSRTTQSDTGDTNVRTNNWRNSLMNAVFKMATKCDEP